LCLLYTSLRWFASKVQKLRHITHHEDDSSRRGNSRPKYNRRWTVLNETVRLEGKPAVYLPMTSETVM
jgi:exocyst complex component 4